MFLTYNIAKTENKRMKNKMEYTPNINQRGYVNTYPLMVEMKVYASVLPFNLKVNLRSHELRNETNSIFDFVVVVKGETFNSYLIKSLRKNTSWRWKGT